jgi:PIN domain
MSSSMHVILDACVLFPGSLRDVLLRAADEELYRLHLTDHILGEVRKNLVGKKQVTEERGLYIVNRMKERFHPTFVTNHTLLIPTMPINEKDRHVLAAAVASGSSVIVTQNLKDFPQSLLEPFGIEPLSADDFLLRCFSRDEAAIVKVVRSYASGLKNPPLTMQQALGKLAKLVPNFVQLVQQEYEI